jgi:hypothetical protein
MIIRDTAQDVNEWAAQQWGTAELGDQRRTARAVVVGAQLASNPAGSLPEQTASWKDLKAAYRLFNEPDVTHARLSLPHRRATLEGARLSQGVVLFIQDGSELDFTPHSSVTGLGRLKKATRHGLLLHSCLALTLETGEVGLAAQRVWRRGPEIKSRLESKHDCSLRATEYDVWAETLQELGAAPSRQSGVRWISVGDRASDIYGYFRQAQELGWEVVARASRNRIIYSLEGERNYLMEWARGLPAQASAELSLRGRDGRPKRTAKLRLAWSECEMPAPQDGKERKGSPLRVSVIRAWEEDAPEGVEPLDWVLITSLVVRDAEGAQEVLGYYEKRWVIEEYHKCLKSGCAMEARQLETADGLEALLGLLSIVAVRLLQLRETSRLQPDSPARHYVEPELLTTLQSYLKLPPGDLTLREFWRGVARLGGFLGRRSDGDPGWQTLWRGWHKLQDLAWRPTT